MSDEGRLTNVDDWEQFHDDNSAGSIADGESGSGDQSAPAPGWLHDYSGFALEQCYSRHLPPCSTDGQLKILEIGSAPGHLVTYFHREYGYDPYGLEYAPAAAEVNRRVFEASGISRDNVIEGDFFDEGLHRNLRENFDVVCSFGFLEHFSDPRNVIDLHVNLVKPGGYLVITIPNFRYLNYLMKCFYNTNFIESHNLGLMEMGNFRDCFVNEDLTELECRYIGGFRFPQPTQTQQWKRVIEALTNKSQLAINLAQKVLTGSRGIDSRLYSPNMVYVGRRNPV